MINKIIKSTDCARNFDVVYFEPRANIRLTALSIDSYNPLIIYVGNSVGDIIQSQNGGDSWAKLSYRFPSAIIKILVSFHDTRNLYVLTRTEGVFFSSDGGDSFQSWERALRPFPRSFDAVDLVESHENPDHLIFASRYGLLQTLDQGKRFEEISILTRPAEIPIYAVALSSNNSHDLYYTDSANFYHSPDGGATWIVSPLPFARPAVQILLDPTNTNVIYLGLAGGKK